jgi:hypothetical protein
VSRIPAVVDGLANTDKGILITFPSGQLVAGAVSKNNIVVMGSGVGVSPTEADTATAREFMSGFEVFRIDNNTVRIIGMSGLGTATDIVLEFLPDAFRFLPTGATVDKQAAAAAGFAEASASVVIDGETAPSFTITLNADTFAVGTSSGVINSGVELLTSGFATLNINGEDIPAGSGLLLIPRVNDTSGTMIVEVSGVLNNTVPANLFPTDVPLNVEITLAASGLTSRTGSALTVLTTNEYSSLRNGPVVLTDSSDLSTATRLSRLTFTFKDE